MFDGWLHENPGLSFYDVHWVVWENYPQAFEEFWGLDSDVTPEYLEPDDWEEFRRLYRLAERLGEAVIKLVRPRRLPEREFTALAEIFRAADADKELMSEIARRLTELGRQESAEAVREFLEGGGVTGSIAKAKFFHNAMQIIASYHFDYELPAYAARMIELVEHLVRTDNRRTQAYLARVAECYIRGMEAEFAVMARAVMQSDLERVLPEEAARSLVRTADVWRLGLAGHIEAAVTAGMVELPTREAMLRIKQAGDDAAHAFPQLAPRPSELMDDLTHVLRHLEQYPDAG